MSDSKPKILENLLSKLRDLRRRDANHWQACCPAHNDRNPSLSITLEKDDKILLYCHAGCELEDILYELGIEMKDLFFVNEENVGADMPKSSQHCNSCTLSDYARYKGLPVTELEGFGMQESRYGGRCRLVIPYLDEDGNQVSIRYRNSLVGDNRFEWKKGANICLYGLWKLQHAYDAGHIILVEGESDCHTLWSCGFPAVGVPGATNWKEERDAVHFEDIPKIYLVREPDQGGDTLVEKLRTSSIAVKVRVINLGECKDPSELYLDDPDAFYERFQKILASAIPLNEVSRRRDKRLSAELFQICRDIAEHENILELFEQDIARLGVIGERENAGILYLALTTRFFDNPVSIVVKGQSSTGKILCGRERPIVFPARCLLQAHSCFGEGNDLHQ